MGIRKQGAGICALVAAALLFSAVHSVGFASNSATQATLQVLQYLSSQQSANDGSVGESISQTSEFIVSAAVAGYDPNTLTNGGPSAVHYLQGVAGTAASSAGNTGFLIQAAVAAAADPTTFGGVDLVTQLTALYHTSATTVPCNGTAEHQPTGFYGSGEAFDQALALIGLEASHQAVPPAAVAYLHAVQDADGGWNYLALQNDPCGYGSDTNSTAIILMALDGAGDHTLDASALAWIKTQQGSDGGFPYQAPYSSDPDSDALVLQALIAAKQDPTGALWSVSGNNVLVNLLGLQDPSGGYAGYSGVDTFTTAQVPLGLERAPYPLDFSATQYYTAGNGLPTPAPTATPAPSGTPSAPSTPTATPTPAPTATVVGGLTPPVSTTAPTPAAPPRADRYTPPDAALAAVNPTPTGSVEALSSTPSPTPSPIGAVLGARTVTSSQQNHAQPSGSYWLAYLLAVLVGIAAVGGAGALYVRRRA